MSPPAPRSQTTIPVRLTRETRADWQQLVVQMTTPVGRIVTLAELAAAITAVASKDPDAIREELIRQEAQQ